MENQTYKNIKVFRTNNGCGLCGKDLENLCKQCGIGHKNTTPYTPWQNGVVERMNMTLMDKSRIMLSGVGITQEF
jgi:transposase InsO family protein